MRRKRRKSRAARKGKWPPRGTGTTVLTYPCPSQPCFGGSKECAQVTGKAGEKRSIFRCWAAAHPGQDRRLPSVVTHSRLQRATSVRSRVGIVLEDGSEVAIDWVTGWSCSSARRRLDVQSGQRKGRKGAAARYPSVAVRDRGHWKGVAGSGWAVERDSTKSLLRVEAETISKIIYAAECENASRTRSPRARTQVRKWPDCRARITSKELAQLHSVKNGILRSACSTRQKMDANFGDECSYAHRQVDEQPCKKSKKNGGKISVAILKNTRQLGFQDMELPKSSSILRKSSNIQKPKLTCKIHETRCTSRQHSRPKSFAWSNLPRWSSSE